MTTAQILNRAFTMVRNLVLQDRTRNSSVDLDLGVLRTLKLMDDRVNHFGTTPHVPVTYQDADGNWQFGWIPQHVWESVLKPMVTR